MVERLDGQLTLKLNRAQAIPAKPASVDTAPPSVTEQDRLRPHRSRLASGLRNRSVGLNGSVWITAQRCDTEAMFILFSARFGFGMTV